jgi:hypothetical protein
MTDLKYLHNYLYHGSPNRHVLSAVDHDRAFALCDGYGTFTTSGLRANGLNWDWSHVRDSTDEALATARKFVEARV